MTGVQTCALPISRLNLVYSGHPNVALSGSVKYFNSTSLGSTPDADNTITSYEWYEIYIWDTSGREYKLRAHETGWGHISVRIEWVK